MPREPRTKQTARKTTGATTPRRQTSSQTTAKAPRVKATAKKATNEDASPQQTMSFTVPLPSLIQMGFPPDQPPTAAPPKAPRTKQTAKKGTGAPAPRGTKSTQKDQDASTSHAVVPITPAKRPRQTAKKTTNTTSQQHVASNTQYTMSFNVSLQMQENQSTKTIKRSRAPRTKQMAKKTKKAKPPQPSRSQPFEIEDVEMGEPD